MADNNGQHYQYSVTNNTRAANAARPAPKHTREPLLGLSADVEPKPKRTRGTLNSLMPKNDRLRGVDTAKSTSRVHAAAGSSGISRSSSQTGQSASQPALGQPALRPGHAKALGPRQFGVIDESTHLMQDLDGDVMAGFTGLPEPVPNVEDGYETSEKSQAAQNTNVEQLREFAKDNGFTAARYSHCVIERYGPPPPDLVCNECGSKGTAFWRHMFNPYHRVRYLVGTRYMDASLRDAGVFIQLCPMACGEDMCPGYGPGEFALPSDFDAQVPPNYDVLDASDDTAMDAEPDPTTHTDSSADDPESPAVATFMSEDPDNDLLPSDAREPDADEGDADGRQNSGEDGAFDGTDGLGDGKDRARGRQARIRKDPRGLPVMVIVDKTSIHQLGIC
ncbi:unnamed protein product [Peniophora sp. CBMAI 1063]|nr:unnamed protein product [Peniophora sp. CBMAI 1063]